LGEGGGEMREILFRGKTEDGDWVEGSFLNIRGVYYIIPVDLELEDCVSESFFFDIAEYAVIPETVGQYTGLNDKEGNKIFIGDLLQKEHNSLQRPQEEVFRVRELDIGGYVIENENDFGYLYNHNDNSKVIGNIHDKPELLEGIK
jgi:uncharacterized phage protein (TIGR01671 family)